MQELQKHGINVHLNVRYAIPPCDSERFLQYFNKKYEKERLNRPRLLYDIVCQISPIELSEQSI